MIIPVEDGEAEALGGKLAKKHAAEFAAAGLSAETIGAVRALFYPADGAVAQAHRIETALFGCRVAKMALRHLAEILLAGADGLPCGCPACKGKSS